MTTPINGKTYLPGMDLRIEELCEFVSKYGDRIITVTGILEPGSVAAMTTLIGAIQAGCLLVQHIHKLYDPEFGDTVSG